MPPIRSRTIIVVFAVIAWAVVFALIQGFVAPLEKVGLSLANQGLALFDLAHVLLLYTLAIVAVYLLFKRNFVPALSLFFGACVLYVASYAAAALRGDGLIFTSGSHRQIVDVYNNREAEFRATDQAPHLFSLGERCGPPGEAVCGCWILVDPSHSNEIKNEIGGWHRPKATVFSQRSLPITFAIVDVKVINPDAYSVLGCSMDMRSWIP